MLLDFELVISIDLFYYTVTIIFIISIIRGERAQVHNTYISPSQVMDEGILSYQIRHYLRLYDFLYMKIN